MVAGLGYDNFYNLSPRDHELDLEKIIFDRFSKMSVCWFTNKSPVPSICVFTTPPLPNCQSI